jgi:hypothetical protein
MSDQAFIGQIFFERESDNSPGEYERICEVYEISGIGETNSEEDVTTFCSEGSREYIAGLSEGANPSITCLYKQANAAIQSLIDDVKGKANHNYRLAVEESSPTEYFTMEMVPLSWELGPNVETKNSIVFGFRISGPVVIS